jgi:hypothetical protein
MELQQHYQKLELHILRLEVAAAPDGLRAPPVALLEAAAGC